jgi:hypothetical protein
MKFSNEKMLEIYIKLEKMSNMSFTLLNEEWKILLQEMWSGDLEIER